MSRRVATTTRITTKQNKLAASAQHCAKILLSKESKTKRRKRNRIVTTKRTKSYFVWSGAIIGDGDRKRGVHAAPSKKTNVLFLEKIAPPSTS